MKRWIASGWFSCLTVGLLFSLFALTFGQWWSAYEIDPDEGLNLGKAALVATGYGPYGELWNDQPPVLTVILALFEFVFPNDVLHARLIILTISSILIGTFFFVVRRAEGVLPACFAVLLLISSFWFQRVSVTVLVGLPAITLAIISLALNLSQFTIRTLAISGALFGIALQTKFFVMTMAPAMLTAIFLMQVLSFRRKLFEAAIWILSCAATFVIILWASGQPFVSQIIAPHLKQATAQFSFFGSLPALLNFLKTWPLMIPFGLIGIIASIFRPSKQRIVVFLLLVIPFIVLSNHSPLFYHHIPLVALPLAWFAGIGTADIEHRVSRQWHLVLGAAVVLTGIVGIYYGRAPIFHPDLEGTKVISALKAAPSRTKWMIGDRPMDAYRAGLLIPPSLVVFSAKRLANADLDPILIQKEIKARLPTHVIFRRFPIDDGVSAFLNDFGYQKIARNNWTHFVIHQKDR